MTTICEVPTKSKLVPCFQDKVLTPSDTQPGGHTDASFPLQQTTSELGVQFGEVVTGLLGLPSPKKPAMQPVQIKACHRDQNDRILIDTSGWLPHINLRIATTLSLSFPP
jgi:hypothetical protein